MIQYKDWAPSAFDPKGLALEGRQDWWVVPVIQTRDSGSREESNFCIALKILGGEGKTVEVHRFGHWGPGWFEIILCHPDKEQEVQSIQDSLDNYPVLDEEDLSRREGEEYRRAWEDFGHRKFLQGLCEKFGVDERVFQFLEENSDLSMELYQECCSQSYIEESGGITLFLEEAVKKCRWKWTNEVQTRSMEKNECS